MSAYPSATDPHVPFPTPLGVPTADITDSPLVCIQINAEWLSILAGLVNTLTAHSTWSDDDPAEVDRACNNGFEFLSILIAGEACPVPIEFQVNPTDTTHWQYSLDGGGTWIDGPLTTVAEPTDVVKTDPTTDATNLIAAAFGVDTLAVQALGAFGAQLRSDTVAAFLSKRTDVAASDDALMQIAAMAGGTYPLIETIIS